MKKRASQQQQKPIVAAWGGSSPVSRDTLKKGLAFLKAEGFEVLVPANTRRYASRKESASRPYLAGPDRAKVTALVSLLRNSKITNILGTRGGYGCLRLLPLLDEVKIRLPSPKHFWGYSDYTVLQNYLHSRFGQKWVHAPHVNSDALHSKNTIEARAWRTLSENSTTTHKLKRLSKIGLSKNKVVALLIGGNLTSFVSLLGTPWEPRPRKPFILFLEDLNEAPYRLDRMLTQLAQSKMFARCQAVVLGHFTDCGNWQGVFKTWAKEHKIPVYDGILSGHDRPNVPLVLGALVTLEKKSQNTVTLQLPNLKLGC